MCFNNRVGLQRLHEMHCGPVCPGASQGRSWHLAACSCAHAHWGVQLGVQLGAFNAHCHTMCVGAGLPCVQLVGMGPGGKLLSVGRIMCLHAWSGSVHIVGVVDVCNAFAHGGLVVQRKIATAVCAKSRMAHLLVHSVLVWFVWMVRCPPKISRLQEFT